MKVINRTVVVVKPRQPFADWANSLDAEGHAHGLDFFRQDCHVYLLDEVEEDGDEEQVLKHVYAFIFESELSGWMLDAYAWPERRDYRTFRAWFDVEIHTVVIDLGDGALEAEEF